MNYAQVKKLDEDTQRNLKEGSGPVDECLCSLLAPPDESKGLRGSIKKALASIGGRKPTGGATRGAGGNRGGGVITGGPNSVQIPLTFEKGGRGIFTTKEEVKRTTTCGKCGCDNEKFFLKHSFANIRITSPDVSSICPCPTSCLPGKDRLNNNISVTVEHVTVSDSDADDHNAGAYEREALSSIDNIKPVMDRSSAKELVEHVWKEWNNLEDPWSRNIEEEASEDVKTLDNRQEEHFVNTLEHSKSFGTEEHEKTILKKPNPEV